MISQPYTQKPITHTDVHTKDNKTHTYITHTYSKYTEILSILKYLNILFTFDEFENFILYEFGNNISDSVFIFSNVYFLIIIWLYDGRTYINIIK